MSRVLQGSKQFFDSLNRYLIVPLLIFGIGQGVAWKQSVDNKLREHDQLAASAKVIHEGFAENERQLAASVAAIRTDMQKIQTSVARIETKLELP